MNANLRRIFNIVVALMAILGISSSIIMVVRSSSLNADPRNVRALYNEFAVDRGPILANDGRTVLATSTKVNDAFQYQRTYPQGDVYAPVTGFVSINQRARYGIEASRNQQLSGLSDSLWIDRTKSLIEGSTSKGAIIETSIDPKLQTLAYNLMKGKRGSVVAIEPSTGRILAMVSTPSYNPNSLATHDTQAANAAWSQLSGGSDSVIINNATRQLFAPGSTFKLVVAAAALESGKYTLDSQIPAGASYTLPGTSTQLTNTSHAADGANGRISLSDAIAYSSNTAFAQLAVALGKDTISDMAKKMGFGSSIVVDGNDTLGTPMASVPSVFPDTLSDDRLALSAIGQGDTKETPLLNAMITAAIANGGVMLHPTLVDRVRSSDLSVISTRSTTALTSDRISQDTASSLNTAMQSVITKEAPNLKLPGITIAAKTGTAQVGLDKRTNNGWITAFAPADNPKIAISVVVTGTTKLGADSAGPIMKQLMQEYLHETR